MMSYVMRKATNKINQGTIVANERSLSGRAASGFLWMLGQTFGSKIFGFATQIALARLLARSDFGLVALAYTAVAFAGVIRQTGIQQILVQRHAHFRRWVTPAFWFELTVGIATAVLLAATSPIAAQIFHSRTLIGLILVIALAAPLSPWFVIPTARLTIDLRFKAIAAANISYNFIAMAMSVLLAWRGFGAYSFVIPLPVAGAIRAFWLWRMAKPRVRKNPQLRRWKFLVGDSGYMLATGFITSAMLQAGSLALGLMYSKAVVGQFFFAFNISAQVAQLLSQNVGSVLMPAFAKLQENRGRQTAAIVKSSRLLAFISIPLCLLLASIASPLVLLVYGGKWLPAAPVLQLLAVAAALNIPNTPAVTAMQSQGRFSMLFWWTLAQAPALFAAVFIGAWFGGATGVGLGWVVFMAIASPLSIGIVIRGRGAGATIAGIYLGPITASILSIGPTLAAIHFFAQLSGHHLFSVTLSAAGLCTLYPLFSALLCPGEFAELQRYARDALFRTAPPAG